MLSSSFTLFVLPAPSQFSGNEPQQHRVTQGSEGAGITDPDGQTTYHELDRLCESPATVWQGRFVACHVFPGCLGHPCAGGACVSVAVNYWVPGVWPAEHEAEPMRSLWNQNDNVHFLWREPRKIEQFPSVGCHLIIRKSALERNWLGQQAFPGEEGAIFVMP